jgi:hypothetical protein
VDVHVMRDGCWSRVSRWVRSIASPIASEARRNPGGGPDGRRLFLAGHRA